MLLILIDYNIFEGISTELCKIMWFVKKMFEVEHNWCKNGDFEHNWRLIRALEDHLGLGLINRKKILEQLDEFIRLSTINWQLESLGDQNRSFRKLRTKLKSGN